MPDEVTPQYDPKRSAVAGLKGLGSTLAGVVGAAVAAWFADPETAAKILALVPVKRAAIGGFALSFLTDAIRNWLKNKDR